LLRHNLSFQNISCDKSEFGGSAALHFRAFILWYKQRTFREAALEKKMFFYCSHIKIAKLRWFK